MCILTSSPSPDLPPVSPSHSLFACYSLALAQALHQQTISPGSSRSSALVSAMLWQSHEPGEELRVRPCSCRLQSSKGPGRILVGLERCISRFKHVRPRFHLRFPFVTTDLLELRRRDNFCLGYHSPVHTEAHDLLQPCIAAKFRSRNKRDRHH